MTILPVSALLTTMIASSEASKDAVVDELDRANQVRDEGRHLGLMKVALTSTDTTPR